MFRVVGRDARGAHREISVCAPTEDEARAVVLRSGDLATIDQVSTPPALPPRYVLRLSGWTVTFMSCLVCLGFTGIGLVIGGWTGHIADESATGELIRTRWLVGGLVGGVLGLICGVSLQVAFLKRFWQPR